MTTNPVEEYAKEEFPVDSITSLAKASGVTYGTVHKTIQGLYGAIPKSLAEYLGSNSEYREPYWQTKYSLWQKDELEILRNDIKEGKVEATVLFLSPAQLAENYATFTAWRNSLSYSQIDFCKTFLLHQTIINNYESGKMVSLPVSLKERLTFLGMTDDYIKAVGDLSV